MYKKNSVQYSKLYEYHMRCFIVAGCWLLYRSTTVPYILQLYMRIFFICAHCTFSHAIVAIML